MKITQVAQSRRGIFLMVLITSIVLAVSIYVMFTTTENTINGVKSTLEIASKLTTGYAREKLLNIMMEIDKALWNLVLITFTCSFVLAASFILVVSLSLLNRKVSSKVTIDDVMMAVAGIRQGGGNVNVRFEDALAMQQLMQSMSRVYKPSRR